MEPQKTPRKRSFLREVVPDWRPTREQALWTARIIIVLVVLQALFVLIGAWLWGKLGIYIDPKTATGRKDLVQAFAVVVAGIVASVSALAAVGNLYVSRRNLQQQRELEWQRAERERELEDQRAQGDALPAYLDQMFQLLRDKDSPLRQSNPGDVVRLLARVRTLTVLERLDGSRKRTVVRLLTDTELIKREQGFVDLWEADLSGAELTGADLKGADLTGTNLERAELYFAQLVAADLRRAYLNEASLDYANLTDAEVTTQQLKACSSLEGATMPDGQVLKGGRAPDGQILKDGPTFKDWLKDREGRKEDG